MLAALSACSGGSKLRAVSDSPVKIGNAYSVPGATYVPADDLSYDAVGYASWYGSDHEGKPTARGEPFRRHSISAAHRTLPLPSYVEVTALDTGRTILVRINDRGPFRPERIIDLSEGAARQLGVRAAGVAPVRVRRVEPNERERRQLREGKQAAERPTVSPGDLAELRQRLNRPAITYQSTSSSSAVTAYLVQIASFSDHDNAARVARRVRGSIRQGPSGYWQVLLGPYLSDADAREGVEAARRQGYSDAIILNR